MNTSLSGKIYESLCEVIPGGVNSPVRAFKSVGLDPMIASRAQEDLIIDAEQNSFIDYCGSWGALILGAANRDILDAVQKRMYLGTSFGVTTEIEEKLARKIVDNVSSVDKVRFVSSGTEAAMSAVRLARGFTKRNMIVKFNGNYHGHSDSFLVKAGSGVAELSESSSAGIPEEMLKWTASLEYNDTEKVKEFLEHNRDSVAAVILEPVAGNMGVVPATNEFIHMLREATEKIGALLIFDEVITGFRVALGGAQSLYDVRPDLTCFGKIIGGGFPAAAFGGRGDIMDYLAPLGPVYQAGTLSGNPVAMEAGYQTLIKLEQPGFYEKLNEKAALIIDPISKQLETQNACIQRIGSMFTLFFGVKKVHSFDDTKNLDTETFTRFFQFLYKKGIYIPPSQFESWFVSSVHTSSHLEKTVDAVKCFFQAY